MKYFGIALLTSLCLFSACKEEKKTTDIITQKPIIVKKQGPVALEATDNTDAVQWLGKTYTVEIHRRSDKSLPLTRDESGAEYYDNRIEVKIIRPDGTEFLNREFTKQSFSSYLNESTLKDGALLAVVYNEVKDDHLLLAASVGSPDAMSEEYVPFVITISRMGDIRIERDNRLDEIPEDVQSGSSETDDEYDGV
ncbi:MAG: DUF4738 domain-containing protein [Prevotella sp.]|nr:DUF4738 domain-containing protein [Prevotella sp.]